MWIPMSSQNSVEQSIPYFVFYHRFVPNSGNEELILKPKWIIRQTKSVTVYEGKKRSDLLNKKGQIY